MQALGRWLVFALVAVETSFGQQQCVGCHPKEVTEYAKTAMARSIAKIASIQIPDGDFSHGLSGTNISIRSQGAEMRQTLTSDEGRLEQRISFVIGSGNHAFGFLIVLGDSVFQSPLSYYTTRRLWGVAPGYEEDPQLDFSRPVTAECLSCHSDKPLPIADSLNRYQPGVFASLGISCQRCHGDVTEHLMRPLAGSIINPAKLSGAVRASICESCHLTGESRIPNPGKSITDFRPGELLEDSYTTYVKPRKEAATIKVVSQVEQLALSRCARASQGRLWCGSCHNPHEKPVEVAAYFRTRCLTCHAATLEPSHAAPGKDCVGCHMPKLPAYDGGHTAFTNHDISIYPRKYDEVEGAGVLRAWREPEDRYKDRNLALALVATGEQEGAAPDVIRGFRLLSHIEKNYASDPAVLTAMGSLLLQGKEPGEALTRFQKAIQLRPNYAPYHVNAAVALAAVNRREDAQEQLKTALTLDPMLSEAVTLLAQIDEQLGNHVEASELRNHFAKAMGLVGTGSDKHP